LLKVKLVKKNVLARFGRGAKLHRWLMNAGRRKIYLDGTGIPLRTAWWHRDVDLRRPAACTLLARQARGNLAGSTDLGQLLDR
jgi:hypothetical protein